MSFLPPIRRANIFTQTTTRAVLSRAVPCLMIITVIITIDGAASAPNQGTEPRKCRDGIFFVCLSGVGAGGVSEKFLCAFTVRSASSLSKILTRNLSPAAVWFGYVCAEAWPQRHFTQIHAEKLENAITRRASNHGESERFLSLNLSSHVLTIISEARVRFLTGRLTFITFLSPNRQPKRSYVTRVERLSK